MARAPRTAKTAVPPELAEEIATTQDGRDVTQPFVHELRQFKDPRLLAAVDWGVYDRIRKDDQVKACMGQRIGAVVSAEWDVLPGDDADPRSVQAADDFKAMLGRISWDRITEKMLWVNFNGLAAAELVWRADKFPNLGQGVGFRLKVRHARRFRVDKDNNWRMLTVRNRLGELLPDRKFWMLTAGATDDDEPYGHGLADWLYWPTLFKRNGIRFWNLFLDKFGSPTTVAKYRRGTPKADVDKLLQAIAAMARDSGIAVPEGTSIDQLVSAAGQGATFEQMCRYQDGAIAKIIVGQTMTTDNGSSRSQAEVHAGVALDFKKADADLLSTSFSEGPARWWTDINYGTDVAAPIVTRSVEEEADLAALASTDSTLKGNGWVRTDESFRDTYGDGYERAAEPEPKVEDDVVEPGSKPEEIVPEDEVAKARAKRASNFAEASSDIIDQVVDDLLAQRGYAPFTGPLKAVIDALAVDAAKFDKALLRGLEVADVTALTQALARVAFATRLEAETAS